MIIFQTQKQGSETSPSRATVIPTAVGVTSPSMLTNDQQRIITASMEEESRPMLYDAHDKKTLVLSVRSAVEKLVSYFSPASTEQERVKLGNVFISLYELISNGKQKCFLFCCDSKLSCRWYM